MLRAYKDIANLVTLLGLGFSFLGLWAAIQGRLMWALTWGLQALLCDHLDGAVARRQTGRLPSAAAIGKHLDSLVDVVSAGVLPAAILLKSGAAPVVAPAAVALLVAAVTRLSAFEAFGLTESGRFRGVPVTYTMPVLSAGYIAAAFMNVSDRSVVLAVLALILAAGQVSAIEVPPLRGKGYPAIVVIVLVLSILLAWTTKLP